MIINIEQIQPHNIAYIRQTGPYSAGNKHAMERLKAWAADQRLLNDESIIFGIAQDNPETTAPEDCRYDACLAVSENFRSDDEFISLGQLDGGLYAVFTVAHTAKAILEAWQNIFPELQRQSLIADFSKPIIERYDAKMINHHQCEICVPLLAYSFTDR